MTILLVIQHADPARGGAERYTVDLATALAGRGHRVALAAQTFADIDPRVERVPLDSNGATRTGRYLRFLDSLDGHLASHRYDVIHAMTPVRQCTVYHPHSGLAAEAIRTGHLKHKTPVRRSLAAVANRLNPKRRMFERVERTLLTSAAPPVVLCLSDYIKADVRRHYSLPEDRLQTLFNAVDLHRFDPDAHAQSRAELRQRFNIPPTQVVALIIAQDFARKGLAEAIEAVARINDPRLTLLVVGKQDPAPYAALAQSRNIIAPNVVFAGSTPDPRPFYAGSDFFVLPTRHDPCSLVVLESLAMGLPVISTTRNGACEIMRQGEHGYVLPNPEDVDALAEKMRLLLDDATRARMSTACRELRSALSYDTHLDRLESIYRLTL